MPNNTPLRLGVIGAGWFASRRHLPDTQDDDRVELAALCRRDEGLLNRMGDHFGVGARFTDYREMIDQGDLDAVLIATPHNVRRAPSRYALEHGLHVLMEKPLTITVEEGRELVELAADRELVLTVALNPPFWKQCHAIREELASIGEVETIEFLDTSNAEGVFGRVPLPDSLPGVVPPTMFRADAEANGGGNLIDGGSHLISELLWCTGQVPVEVTCRMDNHPGDMRSLTTLRLPNGALCSISALADSKHPGKRVHHVYYGSEGSVYATGWPFEVVTRPADGDTKTQREDELADVPTPVGDFACAVLTGAPSLSPGSEALKVVSVIEAAYESAATGRPVAPQAVA